MTNLTRPQTPRAKRAQHSLQDMEREQAFHHLRRRQRREARGKYRVVVWWRRAVLRVNHVLFWWHYRRDLPGHLKQMTFFRSVDFMRQCLVQANADYERLGRVVRVAEQDAERWKKRALDAEMSMTADPDTVRAINRMFGTSFPDAQQN